MATSGNGVYQSAKMVDAQAYFQKVVKQELQDLLVQGMERDVAVKMLLHRIVESTIEPEENDVRRVMRQFQMNHEDAVRALIVKQEIGRLKRQGLDAFAAIEELTRKMQRIGVPCEEETKESGKEEEDGETTKEDDDTTANPGTPRQEDKPDEKMMVRSPLDHEDERGAETSGDTTTSLSLCERIDQVSISTTPTSPTTSGTAPRTLSRRTSTVSDEDPISRSAFSQFCDKSRKRRVNSTTFSRSPSPELSHQRVFSSRRGSSNSNTTRSNTSRPSNSNGSLASNRPLSPTFHFPRSKKQKTWHTNEEDTDPLVSTRKTVIPAPSSPTAISARDEQSTDDDLEMRRALEVVDTPPRQSGMKKRQRMTPSSPRFDAIDVADPVVHYSKRHKH